MLNIYNIQNVCHANEQLSLCHFFSINVCFVKHCVIVRAWLNYNAMFYKTFICFFVSEAKPLCFSLCSQMFDDVERCCIYNIQKVYHANEQLSLLLFLFN